MPAPPSTAQKAANKAAMDRAKAVSGASRSVAGKTSFSGGSGVVGSGAGAGATARTGLQQQRGGLLGISNSGGGNSGLLGNMNPPRSLTPGQMSPLGQEAARRALAQTLAGQYSQYQSPPSLAFQDEGMPGGWGQQAFNGGPVKQPAVNPMAPQAGGFSEAQFGGQRLAPGDIYSNPDRSAPALRSVVNGINLTGGGPETKIDSMLKNMGYDNPAGRAAAVGRFDVETGGFDPKVFSGERMGDAGTAYGLAQWRGGRQTAAKDYASQMGISPSDIAGQAAFAGTEMANQYKPSFDQLQGAKSIADAMRGMNSYERPRGYVAGGDPAKVEGYQEAMNRANGFGAVGQQPPVQVAATSAPPQTMAEAGKSMWETYAPQAVQDAAIQAKKVLVDMPAEKIAQYGDFKKAGKLAQLAVGISSFLPGGKLPPEKPARMSGRDYSWDRQVENKRKKTEGGNEVPPVTPPVTTPPASPEMWGYPQYSQAWANLPTGAGGPAWKPKPPSAGLFSGDTSKKKKTHA